MSVQVYDDYWQKIQELFAKERQWMTTQMQGHIREVNYMFADERKSVNVTRREHDGCYLDTVPTIPNQSTACWPLSSHQHCFSYLLGKWCFLVPKNSFTEYFSRFLFSSTLSLYALNLRPKSPQKTLLLVQFFLL